jgi:CheY-like chemotaxis protein
MERPRLKKSTTSAKVLLVEDDRNCSIPVKEYLKLLTFNVEVAEHGAQALAWIKENGEPDVILLDVNMPVMGGVEFMHTYKGTAKIIILSAWADDCGFPYEPYGRLPKPMDMEELRDLIDKAATISPPPA